MHRALELSVVCLGALELSSCGGGGDRTTSPGPLVPVSVASVTVTPVSLAMRVGESRPLIAIARDQAGSPLTGRVVTWSTTEPTVATVSLNGDVTGTGAGSATIRATSEGKIGSAAISVTPVDQVGPTVTCGCVAHARPPLDE